MTRAILFDLFGTLVTAARGARRETGVAMAAQLGVAPEAYDRAYDGMAAARYVGAYTLPELVRELGLRGKAPKVDGYDALWVLRIPATGELDGSFLRQAFKPEDCPPRDAR